MTKPHRTLAGGLTALALLAGLVALPATAASASGASAITAPPGPAISWHRCTLGPDDEDGKALDQAGAACGDLKVPLDYRRPRGRQITLALSRLPATDRAHRTGILLINTGGPGGAALTDVLALRDWMGEAGQRFDLIGMDPRFVGRSTPLDCGWPVGSFLRSGGPDRASFERTATFAAGLARRCGATNAAVLPYASTRNTARDMDRVRAALGESRLSYLGYSYGTFLGSVYTQMFPGRTDRVVLDSAVDPETYGPRLLRPAGAANEAALRDWSGWAAIHDREYHLGRTPAAVLATVDRILAASAQRPLVVGDFRLDETILTPLILSGLSDDRDQPNAELAEVIEVLDQAARTGSAQPTPILTEVLTFLLTSAESATASVQTAIICADAPAPRDPKVYLRDIRQAQAAEPHFASLTRNLGPCAFWPTTPQEAPTRITNPTPALIVQATGDTRTTYPGALRLHRLLTGSRMLTLTGARIHAVFGNHANACIDDQVITYLRTGVPPATDRTCQP